jgi:hypothetical protein
MLRKLSAMSCDSYRVSGNYEAEQTSLEAMAIKRVNEALKQKTLVRNVSSYKAFLDERMSMPRILGYPSSAGLCIRFSCILVDAVNQINGITRKDVDCFDFAI